METLTQSQLIDLLLGLKAATPVTISTVTEVKSRYDKPLYKLSRVNGMACANYSSAMNRLIPFIPKPRQWGHHISPAVIEHSTEEGIRHYLQIKVERSLSHIYLARYGALLKTVRERDIAPYLRKRDERCVLVRDYSLTAIKRIAIGGKRYRIVEEKA